MATRSPMRRFSGGAGAGDADLGDGLDVLGHTVEATAAAAGVGAAVGASSTPPRRTPHKPRGTVTMSSLVEDQHGVDAEDDEADGAGGQLSGKEAEARHRFSGSGDITAVNSELFASKRSLGSAAAAALSPVGSSSSSISSTDIGGGGGDIGPLIATPLKLGRAAAAASTPAHTGAAFSVSIAGGATPAGNKGVTPAKPKPAPGAPHSPPAGISTPARRHLGEIAAADRSLNASSMTPGSDIFSVTAGLSPAAQAQSIAPHSPQTGPVMQMRSPAKIAVAVASAADATNTAVPTLSANVDLNHLDTSPVPPQSDDSSVDDDSYEWRCLAARVRGPMGMMLRSPVGSFLAYFVLTIPLTLIGMLIDFLASVLTLPLFYTIIGVSVLLIGRLISRVMVFSGNSRLIMRSLQQEYAKITCSAIMQDLQGLQELLASIDFGGPLYGLLQKLLSVQESALQDVKMGLQGMRQHGTLTPAGQHLLEKLLVVDQALAAMIKFVQTQPATEGQPAASGLLLHAHHLRVAMDEVQSLLIWLVLPPVRFPVPPPSPAEPPPSPLPPGWAGYFVCILRFLRHWTREGIRVMKQLYDMYHQPPPIAGIDYERVRLIQHFNASRESILCDDGTKIDAILIEGGHHGPLGDPWRDRPTVVLCNPNAGVYELCQREWIQFYTALGINVACANYRGYGASEGTPTPSSMKKDGLALVQFLRARRGVTTILAHGTSLGGIVATHLAASGYAQLLIADRTFKLLSAMAQELVAWWAGWALRALTGWEAQPAANFFAARCHKILAVDVEDEVVPWSASLAVGVSELDYSRDSSAGGLSQVFTPEHSRRLSAALVRLAARCKSVLEAVAGGPAAPVGSPNFETVMAEPILTQAAASAVMAVVESGFKSSVADVCNAEYRPSLDTLGLAGVLVAACSARNGCGLTLAQAVRNGAPGVHSFVTTMLTWGDQTVTNMVAPQYRCNIHQVATTVSALVEAHPDVDALEVKSLLALLSTCTAVAPVAGQEAAVRPEVAAAQTAHGGIIPLCCGHNGAWNHSELVALHRYLLALGYTACPSLVYV